MIRVTDYADQNPAPRVVVMLEIVLPYDLRKKSRIRTETTCGKDIGLFLERGNILKAGDLLRAETGELVRIKAAEEAVSTASCDDASLLLKAAYHLGNRHVPLQLGDWLRYQPDYVLDDMLIKMGLSVVHEHAPFHPESGAYAPYSSELKIVGAHHGHNNHSHDHYHSHGHGHHHG